VRGNRQVSDSIFLFSLFYFLSSKNGSAAAEPGEGHDAGTGSTSTIAEPEIPPEVALIPVHPDATAKKLPGGLALGVTTDELLVVQSVEGLLVMSWVELLLNIPTA
jgi:hypothetical protein